MAGQERSIRPPHVGYPRVAKPKGAESAGVAVGRLNAVKAVSVVIRSSVGIRVEARRTGAIAPLGVARRRS
jgi:hypothetical protein